MVIGIFHLLAILGLLILTFGVLTKKEKQRNILFFIGGILLTTYSIYIKDIIIISLQIIFTLAAGYKLIKIRKKGKLTVKKPPMLNPIGFIC